MSEPETNYSCSTRRKVVKNPPRICSVLAPPGVNLSIVKSVLWGKGIEPIIPSKFPMSGRTITEHAADIISESDLLIAILDSKQSNSNIYFELGYAFGLGKRILVVVPPELALPTDLTDMFYIRASAENREAISFALDQVLSAAEFKKGKPRHYVGQSYHPSTDATINTLLSQLDSLGEEATGEDIEQIVFSALRAGGISVISARSKLERKDMGVDLAVWADELTPLTGNPILIEIKRRIDNQEDIRNVFDKVSQYLRVSNSRWALVLYLIGPSPIPNMPELASSPITFLKVRELIDGLRENSFAQVIRDALNRQVQGSDSQ